MKIPGQSRLANFLMNLQPVQGDVIEQKAAGLLPLMLSLARLSARALVQGAISERRSARRALYG
ncbi:hypothetical protein [Brevundimonas naejangsanensis]|uniref:hypothetical protein n=1 Tax=Brevundimonas naejangsanensis TaxID=588932 RepID=UPI0026EBDC97|nr:hypothetical protein [Brevundimonas naejangsanensis]